MRRTSIKLNNRLAESPKLRLTMFLAAGLILAIAAVTVVSRQKVGAQGIRATVKDPRPVKRVTVQIAPPDQQINSQISQIKALTPEEAQKLAAGFKQLVNQSTEGLVQVKHADGSVSMDLEGRFQNVTVARVNKDGSVTESCVDNPQAAAAFFGIDPKLLENQSNTKAELNRKSAKRSGKQ